MKTIFITKFINKQKELDSKIKVINGNTTIDERVKIYNGFNSGNYHNISIIESLVLTGGVRYEENNDKIKVVFLDNVSQERKNYILSKMNMVEQNINYKHNSKFETLE